MSASGRSLLPLQQQGTLHPIQLLQPLLRPTAGACQVQVLRRPQRRPPHPEAAAMAVAGVAVVLLLVAALERKACLRQVSVFGSRWMYGAASPPSLRSRW